MDKLTETSQPPDNIDKNQNMHTQDKLPLTEIQIRIKRMITTSDLIHCISCLRLSRQISPKRQTASKLPIPLLCLPIKWPSCILGASDDRLTPATRHAEILVPAYNIWTGAIGLRVATGIIRLLAVAEEGVIWSKAARLICCKSDGGAEHEKGKNASLF